MWCIGLMNKLGTGWGEVRWGGMEDNEQGCVWLKRRGGPGLGDSGLGEVG